MSDTERKGDVAQYENTNGGARKRGFKGHCKKFWWIYLIVTLAVILLVVLLVIFVAVPKIAQQKINDAVLNLQGIQASDTQSLNLTMSVESTITTDGSVHATIDAFDGVMYLEDKEGHDVFATLHFPQTESSAYQVVNISQFTPIDDMAAFTTFNTWLLHNETLRVTLRGDTYVHIKGLSKAYPVTFQKTIEMPGLQSFNGTTVQDVEISIAGFKDGTNMKATTTIPNRSLVTFEIGNATFTNLLLGKDVGTTFIDNMILRPGLNNFSIRAEVDQLPILSTISEKPYCENGVLPMELQGKTVVNHGQPLSYYADSLASANQSVPIDLNSAFKAVGLQIKCNA